MKKILFVLLIWGISSIAEASCIRCGLDKLVCEGDPKFNVISQCGQPDDIEEVGEDMEGRAGRGGDVDIKKRKVEKLYYNCGDQRFIKILTIKDGKIVNIQNGDRGSGPIRCD